MLTLQFLLFFKFVWNIFINLHMFIRRDLSGNKIVKLPQTIFYDLTDLEYL